MYSLPDLGYGYGSLSPIISEQTMRLHHQKHHQAYIDKLNAAIEQASGLKSKSLLEMLSGIDGLPEAVRAAIRNNGGGHYNHSLFWKLMSPQGGGEPTGALSEQIGNRYGNFQTFVDEFTSNALNLFGSGWVWLTQDMTIMATPNQDNPIMTGQGVPILGLDVWEHAYYLDYKNIRAEYVKAWWDVVNWEFIERLYGNDNTVL